MCIRDRYGPDHATYLKARINGVDCECLLDTGSEVTILPYDLVKDCRVKATTQTLKAANGSLIPVVGEATVSFSTPKYKSRITGLVTEHVAEPMLGIRWICQNCERWSFREATVTLGGHQHEVTVRLRKEPESPLFGEPADTLRAAVITAHDGTDAAGNVHGRPDSLTAAATPQFDLCEPGALKKAQEADPLSLIHI